ncbi:MAG: cysteine-rich CWC family protein [Bernardetiaceae bacterium]|jgi:hypothetical protein|nr:cysteine-rich CWC family protein [Bernardetiaceae bacterium]
MLKPEPKNCPRCQARLECKLGDVTNCQCSEVHLGPSTQDFLANAQWGDCLCKQCLHHLDQLVQVAQGQRFPATPGQLVEGLHYYKENGYWVFTELYHLLRGKCCGSGCRHCVYGFKKQRDGQTA